MAVVPKPTVLRKSLQEYRSGCEIKSPISLQQMLSSLTIARFTPDVNKKKHFRSKPGDTIIGFSPFQDLNL
jgi:hypothetical protein